MALTLAAAEPPVDEIPAPPRRSARIRRIRNDAHAIETAREIAIDLAKGAAERDRERRLPYRELDLISDAGLFAITVPKEYGGPFVKTGTLAEVLAILASADGSIGQIPQNHFFMLEALRLEGTAEQKRYFYDRILSGERIGNALSESSSRTAHDHTTRLTRDGDGFRVNGRKFYSTGVLFAHWIAVAGDNEAGESIIAFLPRVTPGITVVDDWSGFGQRTTGSGSTIFENVAVHPSATISMSALFARPTSMGPHAQIMHAAIDHGMARGAFARLLDFVRKHTRPWKESGNQHGYEDPYIISQVGDLKIRLDAGEALIARAAELVDVATENPTSETVAAASVAVAEAKVVSTETALLIGSKLIEFGGARATLAEHGLDRYWRDARTHTVHDPIRWKYKVIGDYWLNGINPPRHGAL